MKRALIAVLGAMEIGVVIVLIALIAVCLTGGERIRRGLGVTVDPLPW